VAEKFWLGVGHASGDAKTELLELRSCLSIELSICTLHPWDLDVNSSTS
jgi:hypothetical protein